MISIEVFKQTVLNSEGPVTMMDGVSRLVTMTLKTVTVTEKYHNYTVFLKSLSQELSNETFPLVKFLFAVEI